MRRLLFTPILLFACATLSACEPADDTHPGNASGEHPEHPDTEDPGEGTPQTDGSIVLTVGERSFTATLEENAATQALVKRLAQGELTLRMDDYGDMEKVGSLGFSLPASDRQMTVGPGDLVLYTGRSLCIYYGTNSWSFTRLGRVDGASTREQMLELLGGKGSVMLTLSLPSETATDSVSGLSGRRERE